MPKKVNPLQYLLLLPLRFYRRFISPYKPAVCSFEPSCSAYKQEAIIVHGAFKGFWLGLKRICRCHPWSRGGYDPVPPRD